METNAELHGQLTLLVYIDLANLDVVTLVCDLVHDRRNHAAGTAPRCPEIQQDRLVRLQHFVLKIFLRMVTTAI